MASIQIHEIETPIEDLSYDVAGNITGGVDLDALFRQIFQTIDKIIDGAFMFCEQNPGECI